MACSYKEPSHAFRFPKEESRSLFTNTDHRLDSFDDDNTCFSDDAEEMQEELKKLPTSLLIALTCGVGGLQLIWSTIFSHGSAYLFSLGISQTQSALIWAIAPICGTIVQPIVGAMSDYSRFSWGRRRPFILAGAIGVGMSLAALAWIETISIFVCSSLGLASEAALSATTQYGTIICICMLNLSIQPLQSGIRSLIVDTVPAGQQHVASAWAGRFAGIGNILGYVIGSLPLNFISHDHEMWRFRYLSAISILALFTTVATTIYFIQEDSPEEVISEPQTGYLPTRILRNLRHGIRRMPPIARDICRVQFFAWMGWFGFLFYSTSNISRLYLDNKRRDGVEYSSTLKDDGMRFGTTASLLFSIVALLTTIFVPHICNSSSSSAAFSEKTTGRPRPGWLRKKRIFWSLSCGIYALCAFSMLVVSSARTGILIVALVGVSWGVAQWAPFALIGEEIAIMQVEQQSIAEIGGKQNVLQQGGTIMGVHNAAISAPQILAALMSALIFWLAGENPSDDAGRHGIAWVLTLSGLPVMVAAYLAWNLRIG